MAARLVDAQAPGVAAALRGLAGAASRGGPGGLLAEYALLHLLIRAHERLDQLPEGLAAVVRTRVGYPVSRETRSWLSPPSPTSGLSWPSGR